MYIEKLKIKNFKCFKGEFSLELNEYVNVLVGDNDSGKSTILESINLALSGLFHGRFLRNELSQHLFNKEAVLDYLKGASSGAMPPTILIELYLAGEGIDSYKGDSNSDKDRDASGIKLEVRLDDKHKAAYAAMVAKGDVKGLPIEYYEIVVESFARETLIARDITLSSAYIDSSSSRHTNGSDVYVSRIVKDFLEESELVALTRAHRQMAEGFLLDPDITAINSRIQVANDLLRDHKLSLAVDLTSRNAWESNLLTCIDEIPFQYIGKGKQSLAKIAIALAHKKAQSANVLLVEEPENHLSHTRLNQLINLMLDGNNKKQIIITTHSSFVANKSNLTNLIMLHDQKTVRLSSLSPDTAAFFQKLAGYDTLRLLLCKKAILVEGDSDELIVQRAYEDKYDKLPIEDAIDVISVGISFLRFLEIADALKKQVVVVTDNDGDVAALTKKYADYLGANIKPHINICYDTVVDPRTKIEGADFNFNTLEPRMLAANSRQKLNTVLGTAYATDDDLLWHMRNNKTDCALKIFNSAVVVKFPSYINDAIAT